MLRAGRTLGQLFDDPKYIAIRTQMLNNVKPQMANYPSGYSNWAQLMIAQVFPCYEIAITGPEALRRREEFAPHYIPNRLFFGTTTTSSIALLAEKTMEGSTTIFVCVDKACKMPVTKVDEALKQME